MISLRSTFVRAFKLFELLVMVFSFALAGWVSFYFQNQTLSLQEFLAMRIKAWNFAVFLGLLLVWHVIFSFFALYGSRRLSGQIKESLDVVKATSLGTLGLYLAARLLDLSMISNAFLLIFWSASTSTCILSRLALRRFLNWVRLRGRNLRYMLIVGTNERAIRFARKIEAKPELGYILVGFVDSAWNHDGSFEESGYSIVADFDRFPSFIRENTVDEVILCLPIKSFYDQISTVSKQCEEQGIIVRHITDLFNLDLAQSKSGSIEGEPIISHYTGAMQGPQVQVKRILDILLSVGLILAFSPIFLVAAFLIKISSPGPVLFVQDRVGLNKRRFPLYKFRTMVQGAEKMQAELEAQNEVSGPVFKIKNDPRITSVGKILRKTSIDELPQLFNVLKGDMSLVGPRALPVRDYEGFSLDWHRRRFSVRPGITCLWQVNGRSSIPFEKWMELDMEYIDHWSLWLDIKILLLTVPAVLKGSGAA